MGRALIYKSSEVRRKCSARVLDKALLQRAFQRPAFRGPDYIPEKLIRIWDLNQGYVVTEETHRVGRKAAVASAIKNGRPVVDCEYGSQKEQQEVREQVQESREQEGGSQEKGGEGESVPEEGGKG